MENQAHTKLQATEFEGVDVEKLKIVIRKNLLWIIGIFLAANLAAYLTIRWTKDVYESESEMKLDIKQDATELGIKAVVEDQNINIISGEIEQIKSKVFLNRVIDSLDIGVGYYSIGKVLVDEKYKYSPIRIEADHFPHAILDVPIYIEFEGGGSAFEIKTSENGKGEKSTFGKKITLNGFEFMVNKTRFFDPSSADDYYFIVYSRESLLDYLTKNLTVEPLNFNANTIKITFRDFNALKAHAIVSKIDSLYISYSNEQKNLTNKQKIEWLNNELFQVEKKMEGFENYFENFTLKNKSNNVDEDLKRTIYLINKIDSQRFDLSKRLTELNALIESLSSENPELTPNHKQFLPTYLNRDLDLLQKTIAESNRLSLSYNENTFAFKQKQNELNSLKDQIFGQVTSLKRGWLENMADLNRRKENLEKAFASMPDKNTQFSKNQRFYKLYEEFYLSMMQSKAQFEIAQAGNTPDFKILSPATLPSKPIAPQKLMILGIGLVSSLVLNFFFVGILYLLNNKIISVQEVERAIHIPVLGSIPALRSGKAGLIVQENPKSMASEAIRTLRTSLEFFTSGGAKKTICVSSTVSGEGKSFLAMNLSGVLAMSNKKVILVDLDMRKAKENLPFDLTDATRGVSTILIDKHRWEDCIISTPNVSMDYLPAGPHPPNPSELLLNGTFDQLLTNLKSKYDFIIMDTPPVGLVTDGVMVMKKSDVTIYVLRANYSKKEFINNLSRLTKINKLTNVAVVVNALAINGKAYGYGYYEEEVKKNFFAKLMS